MTILNDGHIPDVEHIVRSVVLQAEDSVCQHVILSNPKRPPHPAGNVRPQTAAADRLDDAALERAKQLKTLIETKVVTSRTYL